MLFNLLTQAACLTFYFNVAAGRYVLVDNYTPSTFFSKFDFFTAGDPTSGFVKFVDQTTAQNTGLIQTNSNNVYIGVDHTNVQPNARPSVRITSKNSYNHGLYILDLAHMPAGACGSWPAFWTVGPNWPSSGEIDIIEGISQATTNAMTLHTASGCSITNNGAFSGSIQTSNCDVNAPNQPGNAGCGISTQQTNTYGAGFNSIGGGVYVMNWDPSAITVWFFPRSAIPSDISSGNPTMSGWGRPLAQFQGNCNIDQYIKNQQIVFDVTFCGAWAGAVWSSGSCASKASTCNSYVANNPSAFSDTYWSINSLKVYQYSATKRDVAFVA